MNLVMGKLSTWRCSCDVKLAWPWSREKSGDATFKVLGLYMVMEEVDTNKSAKERLESGK